MNTRGELDGYTAQLRSLPFVKSVAVQGSYGARPSEAPRSPKKPVLAVKTTTMTARFHLEVRSSNLSHSIGAELIAGALGRKGRTMVFARYIPPGVAATMASHGIQFVDLAGNQHIQIGDRYFVRASGQRPRPGLVAEQKSMQATGYLVYFALLADRGLRDAPIRHLGAAVGVSKSAVSATLAKLARERIIVERRSGERWIEARTLLDRWLVGYVEVVRPRLLVGGYRTQGSNPLALEQQLEERMPSRLAWAFGGGAAAYRLTRHYRGESTLVHVAEASTELPRTLRALRTDQDPSLLLFRAPGPLLLQGPIAHTAHPFLVYTELLSSSDERAREAAAMLRERHLPDLVP